MSLPRIATRDEWLAARKELLAAGEGADPPARRAQRRAPQPADGRDRQGLRASTGPTARSRLLDLFDGRRQLIVYHFMFDPEWDEGCPSCTAGTDELSDGLLEHLHTRDTTLRHGLARAAREARALEGEARAGTIPWYSSFGSDFNYDFGVTIDESRGADQYNFRDREEFEAHGPDFFGRRRSRSRCRAGAASSQVDGRVFHTYSQYARGLESTGGSYYFLDLTALGRQEDWEEPKGRRVGAGGDARLQHLTRRPPVGGAGAHQRCRAG